MLSHDVLYLPCTFHGVPLSVRFFQVRTGLRVASTHHPVGDHGLSRGSDGEPNILELSGDSAGASKCASLVAVNTLVLVIGTFANFIATDFAKLRLTAWGPRPSTCS